MMSGMTVVAAAETTESNAKSSMAVLCDFFFS